MKSRILVVDDEKEIADLLEIYLKSEDYDVLKCYDGTSAAELILTEQVDLAILDIMLPGKSGLELCKLIRERENYPVIMLTAKDSEIDKITGLTIGADDYVTKPFLPLELLARVKAQLRRYERYGAKAVFGTPGRETGLTEETGGSESAGNSADTQGGYGNRQQEGILVCGGILLNVEAHQCFLNEEEILLTPTEFQLLRTLCERRGTVVSAEELFYSVWQDEYYSKSNNTITVHIRHLREKLKDTGGKTQYIKTIWGVGYKIDA